MAEAWRPDWRLTDAEDPEEDRQVLGLWRNGEFHIVRWTVMGWRRDMDRDGWSPPWIWTYPPDADGLYQDPPTPDLKG